MECQVEAMLPHGRPLIRSGRSCNMFVHELVSGRPSGRIPCSPNRAAVPGIRNVGGAVKRQMPLTVTGSFLKNLPTLSFPCIILLSLCLFPLLRSSLAYGQTTVDVSKA